MDSIPSMAGLPSLGTHDLRGSTLGPYRLVTELGAGGMGTVYFAEHEVIGRRAAVKVLHPAVSSPHNVERFFNEARAVNDIRHPNIVDVTDFGQHAGLYYLVMELLEGETLAERLERCGRLALTEVVGVLEQVARGLQAAHRRGVIHRDLKPENIFLTNHPDYPDQVKILDFGIAKLENARSSGLHTDAGAVVGTPAYMSPEQCTGESHVDGRSDIYTLGVVAYEMLSGALPFREKNFGKWVLAHLQKQPPPIKNVRAEVDAVVRQALAKDPERRFPDANAFREAFEAAVRGRTRFAQRGADKRAEKMQQARARKMAEKLELIVERRLCDGSLVVPAMPSVARRAARVSEDEEGDLADVAAVLERDPLLATQLLRVASTRAFGGPGITSLPEAVARMGREPLRGLLVQLSARAVFTSRDPRIQQSFHAIWEHCLAVATVARELADRLPDAAPRDTAYMAGLLHDVGKPVVAALLLELERSVTKEVEAPWIDESTWFRLIERSQQRVGRHLGKRWRLPIPVRDAIAAFHCYSPGGAGAPSNLVRYANALARAEGLDVGDIDPLEELAVAAQGRELLGVSKGLEKSLVRDLGSRIAELTGESTRASMFPAPLSSLPPRMSYPTPPLD